MTRLGRALCCALLVIVALPSAASADEFIQIRRVELADFPTVALTVAVAEGETEPDDLAVVENGSTVSDLTIEPLEGSEAAVDVVLAIDTSGSMLGEPLTAAQQAATDFVTGLPDNVRVGIVRFSDTAQVALPISSDHNRAINVISRLTAVGETALFDGVERAAEMFGGDALRNIVVLSDGADTVSTTPFPAALASVKRSKAVVYSVGLESGEFDATVLRRLATTTDGRYATADAARLAELYAGLAEEISNQLVVSYESSAAPGDQFEIELTTAEGADTAVVLAPLAAVETPTAEAVAPRRVEPSDPLLSGTVGLAIAAGTVFAAIFMIVMMLLGASARKRRDEDLARRMALPSWEGATGEAEDRGPVEWIPDPFVQLGERAAGIGGVGARVDATLERAAIEIRTGEFLALSVLTALVGALIGLLVLPKGFFIILLGIVGALIPWAVVSMRANRRMKKLHEQLVDILMILASSLRAGHSFLQAIDAVSNEVAEPGTREFKRLVAEIRLGRPVDEAMFALAERIDSEDFKWAVIAVNIQRDVGGNLAEVLDTVADTIRDRQNIRRQIDVLSAEGKMSVYVLAGLPVLVTLYMAVVNPSYIGLLFTTRIGIVMSIVAVSLITVGIAWMRRVVKIDV